MSCVVIKWLWIFGLISVDINVNSLCFVLFPHAVPRLFLVPHFSPFLSLPLSPRKSSLQSHSHVSTPSFSSFIVFCSSIDTRTDAHIFVDATDIVITTIRIVNDYYYRTLCWIHSKTELLYSVKISRNNDIINKLGDFKSAYFILAYLYYSVCFLR